ncbi:COG1361 S-layer family protein [Pyrococcus yayanosii]|uniref:S-layer domain protein n=1 Tax=Pyrococcus yayanosii (strain CH1 / JCM 16557) TaxID=529709 RepID=F8AFP0_PYRYC|nr:COG1361 S-layer family protein [Pyrococcus yayanosii]AEH25013.1 hypothetical protein PYCH_13410 [Pyrococcus yayanosii CH1]
MKIRAALLILFLLTVPISVAGTDIALLFEGYLNKGDYVLVGPLTVVLSNVDKNYTSGEWVAFIAVLDEEGNPINLEYRVIEVPDQAKIQELLSNETFLMAMAETLGYNVSNPIEYAQFLLWLNSASPAEIYEAVVKTIEEHPELGLTVEDIMKPYPIPYLTPLRENETMEVEYKGNKLYITALLVYPNGAKLSISGPPGWRASMVQGLVISSIETPTVVRPGDVFDVKVHLKNIGARKVRYLTVILSPTPVIPESREEGAASIIPQTLSQTGLAQGALYPAHTSFQYFDFLEPGEDKVVTFRYKVNENARAGIYPLYLTVVYFVYTKDDQMERRMLFDFAGVTVARDEDAAFQLVEIKGPRIVHPGEDFSLTIRLRNAGRDIAKNVFGELVIDRIEGLSNNAVIPVEGTGQFFVQFVNPAGEYEHTFRLHVAESTKTGTYTFRLRLRYYSGNSNEEKTQEMTFSVTVIRRRAAFIEIEEVRIDPKEVEPGDTFKIIMKLKNVGESDARALEVRIVPYEVSVRRDVQKVDLSALSNLPITGSQELSENLALALNRIMEELARENVQAFLPIGEDNVRYGSIIRPNESLKVEFTLKANERLENGVYPLRVSLKYLSAPDDREISDERLVGVEVTGREMLVVSKVSTSPSRVLPGTDNVEVSFEVENIGSGVARYVILRPLVEPPFELSETSEQLINIGTLMPGDSARASFRINVDDGAKAGTYIIPLELTYKGPAGEVRKLQLELPIIVAEKPRIVIEKVKFDRPPTQGEDVNVYITVRNVGGEQAESVVIEGVVRSSQPFTLVKRTDYIGNLDPGQAGQGVITLTVGKNAIPKTYTIQVRIRAVGDREKGDDNVYIFEGTIEVPVQENVEEKEKLRNTAVATGILALVLSILIYWRRRSG